MTTWREMIEQRYALICKGCSRKVMDPDKKNNQQVYTKNKCPHCNNTKDQVKKDIEPHKRLRVAC